MKKIVELSSGKYRVVEPIGYGSTSIVYIVQKYQEQTYQVATSYAQLRLQAHMHSSLATQKQIQEKSAQKVQNLVEKCVETSKQVKNQSIQAFKNMAGQYFALKTMIVDNNNHQQQSKKRQFRNELGILRSLDHPGIVKIIDYGSTQYAQKIELNLLMKWGRGGSFQRLLQIIRTQQIFRKKAQKIKKYYISQIVSIVDYLQNQNIYHRDLKPDNLILDQNYQLSLIDFGSAQTNQPLSQQQIFSKLGNFHKQSEQKGYIGSKHFISPQMIKKARKVQNMSKQYSKTDLWSLGVLLYYIATDRYPFEGINTFFVLDSIRNHTPDFELVYCTHLRSIIQGLLQKQPQKRIQMQQIKQSPYFQEISFDQVFQQESPIIELSKLLKDIYLFKDQAVVTIQGKSEKRVVGIFRKTFTSEVLDNNHKYCQKQKQEQNAQIEQLTSLSNNKYFVTIGKLDSRIAPKLLPIDKDTIIQRCQKGFLIKFNQKDCNHKQLESYHKILPQSVLLNFTNEQNIEVFRQVFIQVLSKLTSSNYNIYRVDLYQHDSSLGQLI